VSYFLFLKKSSKQTRAVSLQEKFLNPGLSRLSCNPEEFSSVSKILKETSFTYLAFQQPLIGDILSCVFQDTTD